MTYISPTVTSMQRAYKEAVGTHWRLLMLQGAITIVLGCIAMAMPVLATVAVDIYVGWLLILAGAMGLVAVFSTKSVPAFLWSLSTAALLLTVGITLLIRPLAGVLSLTLVLTAFFVLEGVSQVTTSLAYRHVMPHSWIWLLISGLADLALATFIIASWPISAIWALGLLAGINLVSTGLAIVMIATSGRTIASGGPAAMGHSST